MDNQYNVTKCCDGRRVVTKHLHPHDDGNVNHSKSNTSTPVKQPRGKQEKWLEFLEQEGRLSPVPEPSPPRYDPNRPIKVRESKVVDDTKAATGKIPRGHCRGWRQFLENGQIVKVDNDVRTEHRRKEPDRIEQPNTQYVKKHSSNSNGQNNRSSNEQDLRKKSCKKKPLQSSTPYPPCIESETLTLDSSTTQRDGRGDTHDEALFISKEDKGKELWRISRSGRGSDQVFKVVRTDRSGENPAGTMTPMTQRFSKMLNSQTDRMRIADKNISNNLKSPCVFQEVYDKCSHNVRSNNQERPVLRKPTHVLLPDNMKLEPLRDEERSQDVRDLGRKTRSELLEEKKSGVTAELDNSNSCKKGKRTPSSRNSSSTPSNRNSSSNYILENPNYHRDMKYRHDGNRSCSDFCKSASVAMFDKNLRLIDHLEQAETSSIKDSQETNGAFHAKSSKTWSNSSIGKMHETTWPCITKLLEHAQRKPEPPSFSFRPISPESAAMSSCSHVFDNNANARHHEHYAEQGDKQQILTSKYKYDIDALSCSSRASLSSNTVVLKDSSSQYSPPPKSFMSCGNLKNHKTTKVDSSSQAPHFTSDTISNNSSSGHGTYAISNFSDSEPESFAGRTENVPNPQSPKLRRTHHTKDISQRHTCDNNDSSCLASQRHTCGNNDSCILTSQRHTSGNTDSSSLASQDTNMSCCHDEFFQDSNTTTPCSELQNYPETHGNPSYLNVSEPGNTSRIGKPETRKLKFTTLRDTPNGTPVYRVEPLHANEPVLHRQSTDPNSKAPITLNELQKILQKTKEDSHVQSTTGKDVNFNSGVFDLMGSIDRYAQDDETVSPYIGQFLHKLWRTQCFCDVKVQVGDQCFLAHKLVLAAFSDVFYPTSCQPPPSVCFTIPNSTPEAVYQVFKYLYTSSMDLRDDLLEPVMTAALFMGITEIQDVIKDILRRPTVENVALYVKTARQIGMVANITDYPNLIRHHFKELAQSRDFMMISVDDMEKLMTDPEVMVDSEMDTIEVLSSWVQFNVLEREPMVGRLLRNINFEAISPTKIATLQIDYPHIFCNPAGMEVIASAFKYHALKNIPGTEEMWFDRDLLSRPRSDTQKATYVYHSDSDKEVTSAESVCSCIYKNKVAEENDELERRTKASQTHLKSFSRAGQALTPKEVKRGSSSRQILTKESTLPISNRGSSRQVTTQESTLAISNRGGSSRQFITKSTRPTASRTPVRSNRKLSVSPAYNSKLDEDCGCNKGQGSRLFRSQSKRSRQRREERK